MKATIFILDDSRKNIQSSYQLEANNANAVFINDCRFLIYSSYNSQCQYLCKRASWDVNKNQTQYVLLKRRKGVITEDLSKKIFIKDNQNDLNYNIIWQLSKGLEFSLWI
ncbi:hypothetical protein pb186bvf_014280 [Paramecium bursaria]